jgi:exopolysaccharide production protein ExoQ
MAIAGSRMVSHWLNLGPPVISADSYLEGSPVDRAVFSILVLGGIIILVRRRLNWSELFKKNAWIWLFFVFGLISILWSDYPFVSFKRWFKAVGNLIMALIILTEERPYVALGVILRRFAFLLLPLSVLFIRYYPDLGRAYSKMGNVMYTGVAGQKNGLGNICLISGIYFSWHLLLSRSKVNASGKQLHYSVYLLILPMIVWLFYMANSATSLACMIVAGVLFIAARLPSAALKPLRIMTIFLGCIILFGILELFFDVKNTVIGMLGRQQDLTSRVPMWEELIHMVKDPLVGFGFESFWLGDRRILMQERWKDIIQAHNGYLQMYLDLGYIGLFFLGTCVLSGLRKVSRDLLIDYPVAMLRFCFIVVVSFYNYTEATFFGVSCMWVIFLLGTIDISVTIFPPSHPVTK